MLVLPHGLAVIPVAAVEKLVAEERERILRQLIVLQRRHRSEIHLGRSIAVTVLNIGRDRIGYGLQLVYENTVLGQVRRIDLQSLTAVRRLDVYIDVDRLLQRILKRDDQRRESRIDLQRAGYGRNVGLQRRNLHNHGFRLVCAVVNGIETNFVGTYRAQTRNHQAVAIDRAGTRDGLAGIGLILGTCIEIILVRRDRVAEVSAAVQRRELHIREFPGRNRIP